MRGAAVGAARSLAVAGMSAVGAAITIIGLLHVTGPSAELSPVRRTISEYALLETGRVFDMAVLVLAVGSVATLAALVRSRLIAVVSGSTAALLLWSGGLAGVVFFPKHNWAVGPSINGEIHRLASVVAFLSLPVAALLVGRAWRRHPRWGRYAAWSCALGVLSLLCFSPIVVAVALEPVTGVRWWRAIPLGAVERLLAAVEVVTVLALAWWAARASGKRR